jgi:hypothetical protein
MTIDEKFERLKTCLAQHNAEGLQDAIFDLGAIRNDWIKIPDEIVERLLTLLRNKEMYQSPLAGHVLNFFEFESAGLTDRAKWLCIGFLNAHGDEFQDVYSREVVADLRGERYGEYLRMKKPNPQQWKDYLKMKGEANS